MSQKMKYTNLGSSGLRVSRICVGCMSFGDRRGRFSWCIEEKEALPILKACHDAGINFYDTANGYSNGTSEIILGKAIKQFHWRRSNLVIATKLWAPVGHEPDSNPLSLSIDDREAGGYINEFGLSRKHIFDSVDASLERLGLEYIDLLQIHRFDPATSPRETMEALHDVVKSGKVRYIGASSMWAHQFLEYQYTARLHGWTEFISMQNLHNATYREEEREMIPCKLPPPLTVHILQPVNAEANLLPQALKKFGMGMIPWSPVAMGFLTRPHAQFLDSERGTSMNGTFMGQAWTDTDKKINEEIEEIARERGVSMAVISIAWSLSKPFMTSPIIGMSKVERVREAVEAVNFVLTEGEVERIDGLYVPKKTIGFQ
ncbi:hypothetical protein EG328_002552 [Venturia inaequalis]|uniref:NADP-dependent oxidoreductase domain-containing protein n=1 Tax=Venturia inaequalis TaxID=5025 RepID=A0A8H3UTY9_VENIN|nr:hypothetical protein EG328_002552 [Venturia inaequalis]